MTQKQMKYIATIKNTLGDSRHVVFDINYVSPRANGIFVTEPLPFVLKEEEYISRITRVIDEEDEIIEGKEKNHEIF